jgi:hypothetical protein
MKKNPAALLLGLLLFAAPPLRADLVIVVPGPHPHPHERHRHHHHRVRHRARHDERRG